MQIAITIQADKAQAELTLDREGDSEYAIQEAKYEIGPLYDKTHTHSAMVESARGKLTTTVAVEGPWAVDSLISYAMYLRHRLTRMTHVMAQMADEKNGTKLAPKEEVPYPITWLVNGQPVADDPDALAIACAQPDKVFAVGSFQQESTQMRVTDPVYEKSSASAVLMKAVPGTWHAEVVHGETWWRRRVKELRIRHDTIPAAIFTDPAVSWTALKGSAGVDTGKCGFFDDQKYPTEPAAFEYYSADDYHKHPAEHLFFSHCCEIALDRDTPCGGPVPGGFGVLSESGMGDGGYAVLVVRGPDKAVLAARLVFITQTDLDAVKDALADKER